MSRVPEEKRARAILLREMVQRGERHEVNERLRTCVRTISLWELEPRRRDELRDAAALGRDLCQFGYIEPRAWSATVVRKIEEAHALFVRATASGDVALLACLGADLPPGGKGELPALQEGGAR